MVALVAELVNVRLAPTHKEVGETLAETDVGVVPTVNVAVLLEDTVLLQPPVPTIAVMVSVVEPTLANLAAGMVKLPPEGLVTVTFIVLLDDTFAPLKL